MIKSVKHHWCLTIFWHTLHLRATSGLPNNALVLSLLKHLLLVRIYISLSGVFLCKLCVLAIKHGLSERNGRLSLGGFERGLSLDKRRGVLALGSCSEGHALGGGCCEGQTEPSRVVSPFFIQFLVLRLWRFRIEVKPLRSHRKVTWLIATWQCLSRSALTHLRGWGYKLWGEHCA